MLAAEEKIIIEDYKKAVKDYYRNKEVIDIDSKVRINLNYLAMRMEKMIAEAGSFVPPQRLSGFRIFFVVSATGENKIGNISFSLKDNTLMIVPSKVIYSSSHNEEAKGYFLLFNVNFFLQRQFPKHHLLKMNLFSSHVLPYAYLNAKEADQSKTIFETILDEQEHARKKKEELITLKILELIIVCERVLKNKKGGINVQSTPALDFLDLIQQHYKKHHSTTFYAEKLNLHPNSLNVISKRYLGRSAKSAIDAAVITEAKNLLFQTGLSVKEIAFDLGFQSATHFFRFFKNHTGVSPLNYRKTEFENVDK